MFLYAGLVTYFALQVNVTEDNRILRDGMAQYKYIERLSNENYEFFPFLTAKLEMTDDERLLLLCASSLVGLVSVQIKMILHH